MLGTGCVTCATPSTTTSGTSATPTRVLASGRSHADPMSPAAGMCVPMLPLCRNCRPPPLLWMYLPPLRVFPHPPLHREKAVGLRKLRFRFLPLRYPLRGHRRAATGCVRCAPGSIPTRHTHAETPSAKANGIDKSSGSSQVRDLLTSSTSELRLRL